MVSGLLMKSTKIRVPASSANLGPGYDTLGIALGLYMDLDVYIPAPNGETTTGSIYPQIVISYSTPSTDIPLKGINQLHYNQAAEDNLLLQSFLHVVKAKHINHIPSFKVCCTNEIPFGSGLGSSGSAVVGGVILANIVCELNLEKQELIDFCLDLEGHPDNVLPSLLGGYNCAYLSDGNNRCMALPFHSSIKAITVTPNYSLETKMCRKVLPTTYSIQDAVYNIQRVAVLSCAFADPDPKIIYGAMQDKLHQPYRQCLIPGFEKVVEELTPDIFPGLLGVAISGAGPSILALATDNFSAIGSKIQNLIGSNSTVRILEIDQKGAVIMNINE